MTSNYMNGAFDEQRAQIDISGLGDAELRVSNARPTFDMPESKRSSYVFKSQSADAYWNWSTQQAACRNSCASGANSIGQSTSITVVSTWQPSSAIHDSAEVAVVSTASSCSEMILKRKLDYSG
jgi:hypothetical protein